MNDHKNSHLTAPNGLNKVLYQGGVRIQDQVFLSRASYGDGVFETMRSDQGHIPLMDLHLVRLMRGLAAIGLAALDLDSIRLELQDIAARHPNAVIKLIAISAAPGGSYQRAHNGVSHAVVVGTLPEIDAHMHPKGIVLRVCTTRLAQNSSLSGIKHLNRGEQILAANEANAPTAHEGLMLNAAGQVICAISGNVFAVVNGQLCTPSIQGAGVDGVMRTCILRICGEIGIAVSVRGLILDDIYSASELFVCNAIRAVRPVHRLIRDSGESITLDNHRPITQRVIVKLNQVAFRP